MRPFSDPRIPLRVSFFFLEKRWSRVFLKISHVVFIFIFAISLKYKYFLRVHKMHYS